MVDSFKRGSTDTEEPTFLSSGLCWKDTRKILDTQPILSNFLELMEDEEYGGTKIKTGFFGHTTKGGKGIHPAHLDGLYVGRKRWVISLGDSDKIMTIQNIKNGKWFSFKCPHGMMVMMTEEAGGVKGRSYIHRVDLAQDSYIIVIEQD